MGIGVGISVGVGAVVMQPGGAPPETHTITASAAAHGSISPVGETSVNEGANQQFTFAGDSGYAVDSVTVDGSPAATTSPYTFTSVTADHTIAVAFRLMVSDVRQTLYPASGRTQIEDVDSGRATQWMTQTEAQAHNGNIGTADSVGVEGDGSDWGAGRFGVTWTLDPCTYPGNIDKVRVRVYEKYLGGEVVEAFNTITPLFAADVRGTPVVLDVSPTWREFDFLADPRTGLAWANAAAINSAGPWGWLAYLLSADENTWVGVVGYDYEVLVYGTE